MAFKSASLPENILHIVKDKGTEQPFSSEYDDTFTAAGTYLCRQCGLALFRSDAKFPSGCGWPSFDAEIPGTVNRRIEITCARCHAHLGHQFEGEGYTKANIRHCVNALSLDYVTHTSVIDTEEAIVAGGCFWGVEYYFQQLPGVLKTETGYIGGTKSNPTDPEVESGTTGHCEAVRVVFDPTIISYQSILEYFFEIHHFPPADVHHPRPNQYRSAIFYYTDAQKNTAFALMKELENLGYAVSTEVKPVSTFWRADSFHQQYYVKRGKQAECHRYEKKFHR